MPKSKSDQQDILQNFDDSIAELEELDLWDMEDPADRTFWEEYFKVEEILEMNDELDAPTFTISIQNHDTGELRTYNNIRLKPSRRSLAC